MKTHLFLAPALLLTACGPATLSVEMKEVDNSGQTGTARLVAFPSAEGAPRTEVQLNVARGVNGLSQYVGIYEGSCQNVGTLAIKVGLAKDGVVTSELIAEDVEHLRGGHALVLRQDSRDGSAIASCGDLR